VTANPNPAELTEPDSPAAYALARHIADHPVSTVQAAFRYLNAPLTIELHEDSAVSVVPPATNQTAEEHRLARVREWVNSDVVTARNEFGNGYREAQRDIRDLLGSCVAAETPQTETPDAPAVVAQPGKETRRG
jgi:hypothetical protein